MLILMVMNYFYVYTYISKLTIDDIVKLIDIKC